MRLIAEMKKYRESDNIKFDLLENDLFFLKLIIVKHKNNQF